MVCGSMLWPTPLVMPITWWLSRVTMCGRRFKPGSCSHWSKFILRDKRGLSSIAPGNQAGNAEVCGCGDKIRHRKLPRQACDSMIWQHFIDLLRGEMASGIVGSSLARLVLAAILGGIIGLERELNH